VRDGEAQSFVRGMNMPEDIRKLITGFRRAQVLMYCRSIKPEKVAATLKSIPVEIMDMIIEATSPEFDDRNQTPCLSNSDTSFSSTKAMFHTDDLPWTKKEFPTEQTLNDLHCQIIASAQHDLVDLTNSWPSPREGETDLKDNLKSEPAASADLCQSGTNSSTVGTWKEDRHHCALVLSGHIASRKKVASDTFIHLRTTRLDF
jgi:hypothetical protein